MGQSSSKKVRPIRDRKLDFRQYQRWRASPQITEILIKLHRMLTKLRWLVLLSGPAAALFLLTEAGGSLLIRAVEVDAERPTGAEQAVALVTGSDSRTERAANFHQSVGLPLVVIGDDKVGGHSGAALALGAKVLFVENNSQDTEQNGALGTCLLRRHRINSVYLFTDAVHGRRAALWFRWNGMPVTLATGPTFVPGSQSVWRYAPSGAGARRSQIALHEVGGLIEAIIKQAFTSPAPCDAQPARP